MLQNAYFLAKIGADTAENEQHFSEILPGPPRPAPRGSRTPHVRLVGQDDDLREAPKEGGVEHLRNIGKFAILFCKILQ